MPQFNVELKDPQNQSMPYSQGVLEAQNAQEAAQKGLNRAWEAVQRTSGKTSSRYGWPQVTVSQPGRQGSWRFQVSWTTGQPQLIQTQPVHGGFGGSM